MSESIATDHDNTLPQPAWVKLTDRRIVRVSGPGTDKFLNGQFSQSLDDVTASNSPRAAASTPKGRAYCLTRLVRDGDDVLLELPDDLTEMTLTQLRKYLMLFRGTTMKIEPDARLFGLLGNSMADKLTRGASSSLPEPGSTLESGGNHMVRIEDTAEGLARYELWQTSPLDSQWQQALEECQEATLADWRASDIAAGIASLTPTTLEAYVPQMLNWQHVGGIHFRKGCYTGQEVIARMHFLGQLKKSLFRLTIPDATEAPAPGTPLMADNKPAGEIVNSVIRGDGLVEILAVLRHEAATQPLTLDGVGTAEIQPLPYPVLEREPTDGTDT